MLWQAVTHDLRATRASATRRDHTTARIFQRQLSAVARRARRRATTYRQRILELLGSLRTGIRTERTDSNRRGRRLAPSQHSLADVTDEWRGSVTTRNVSQRCWVRLVQIQSGLICNSCAVTVAEAARVWTILLYFQSLGDFGHPSEIGAGQINCHKFKQRRRKLNACTLVTNPVVSGRFLWKTTRLSAMLKIQRWVLVVLEIVAARSLRVHIGT